MRIDSPLMTNVIATGSFSGSFSGSFEGDIQADSVEYANVQNKPVLISGSIGSGGGSIAGIGGNGYDAGISASVLTINGGDGYSGILNLRDSSGNDKLTFYETGGALNLVPGSSTALVLAADAGNKYSTFTTAGHLIPGSSTQDLGSSTNPYRHIYISAGSIIGPLSKISFGSDGSITPVNNSTGAPAPIVAGEITVTGSAGAVRLGVDENGQLTTTNPSGTPTTGSYSGSFNGSFDATTLTLGGTAITATAVELNKLDGVTATTTELNKLDGVTTTTTQLNYLNSVTSNVQNQLDTLSGSSFVITLDGAVTGNGTVSSLGDVTISTTATSDPTLTLTGDVSGEATFTNLGNASLAVTVNDDSHNHIIANIDGLQAALDSKQAGGSYVTTGSAQALGAAGNVLTLADDTLTLTRGDGSTDTVSLAAYLDEDSRSIASGTLNGATGIVTFTRDDATTFTLDLSDLLDDTNLVTSVNSQTGVVVLDADDIDDTSTTHKFATAAQLTKLDGIDESANNYTHPTHPGDDISVDTGVLTGATVISDLDFNITTDTSGHVTDANGTVATRTLTLADLGYTGTTDANTYTHPTFDGDDIDVDTGALTGATVISDLDFNITTDTNGHVTDANASIATRNLTLGNLGFTGDADANKYVHPGFIGTTYSATTGATIISEIVRDTQGHISSVDTRTLTLSDLGYTGSPSANNYYIGLDNTSVVHFEGLMVGQTSGGTANTIRCVGDVVAYYSSDEQFKDNVVQLDGALDKIKQIRGVEFDWNDKQDVYEGHDIGVIAQEVEKVYPELVHHRDYNDSKAVDYPKLTAVLIEAIKELSAKVEALENK